MSDATAPPQCPRCRRKAVWRDCGYCWSCFTSPYRDRPIKPPRPPVLCRQCSAPRPSRPGPLCRACYDAPEVRAAHPAAANCGKRARRPKVWDLPAPDAPTTAAPGTPEKLAVMAQRAEQKRAIFHPADARYEGDPRPVEFLAAGNPS